MSFYDGYVIILQDSGHEDLMQDAAIMSQWPILFYPDWFFAIPFIYAFGHQHRKYLTLKIVLESKNWYKYIHWHTNDIILVGVHNALFPKIYHLLYYNSGTARFIFYAITFYLIETSFETVALWCDKVTPNAIFYQMCREMFRGDQILWRDKLGYEVYLQCLFGKGSPKTNAAIHYAIRLS